MPLFIEQKFVIPELKGITKKTIEEHLKLYAGYVKHANLVLEKIKELRRTDAAQMNCDHVYDEALGDLDTIVRYISGKGKA